MSKKRKIDRDKYKEKIAKILILDNFNKRKSYHIERKKQWYNTVEDYILGIKSTFPKYGDFGHSIQVIIREDGLAGEFNISEEVLAKIVAEYIMNYGETSNYKEIDFVLQNDLGRYIKNVVPTCDVEFFETMWDHFSYLKDRWGHDIKDSMWEEILPEVESAMENVEEDDLIQFDSLKQEEMYFRSYWHYPIDNLGWTKDMLCDWYIYNAPEYKLKEYFYDRYWDKSIHELPLWDGNYYFIEVDKLF